MFRVVGLSVKERLTGLVVCAVSVYVVLGICGGSVSTDWVVSTRLSLTVGG